MFDIMVGISPLNAVALPFYLVLTSFPPRSNILKLKLAVLESKLELSSFTVTVLSHLT